MKFYKRISQQGFTLVELMIVVVLVAILGSISVPLYRGYVATAGAATFLEEVSEFHTYYQSLAMLPSGETQVIDHCALTWQALTDRQSNHDPGAPLYPVSSLMDVSQGKDGLTLEVGSTLERHGVAGIDAAKAVATSLKEQGWLTGNAQLSDSFVAFIVDFQHSCADLQTQKPSQVTGGAPLTSPNLTGLSNGSPVNASMGLAQNPENAICASGQKKLGGRCVTPPACEGGSLSSDFSQCTCPAGEALYQGVCVAKASCGSGGTLATDPSQCASCGSGLGLLSGQCVAKAACEGGSLSSDFSQCTCSGNAVLRQGVCVAQDNRARCVKAVNEDPRIHGNGRRYWEAVASCMGRDSSEWRSIRAGT